MHHEYDSDALLRLADDVDRQHREGMRTMSEDLHQIHFEGEVADELRENRRNLFAKMAVGGGVLTAATLAGPLSGLLPASWAADAPSDADLARFAQSLELAAVAAYKAAAGTGKLDATATSVGTPSGIGTVLSRGTATFSAYDAEPCAHASRSPSAVVPPASVPMIAGASAP